MHALERDPQITHKAEWARENKRSHGADLYLNDLRELLAELLQF